MKITVRPLTRWIPGIVAAGLVVMSAPVLADMPVPSAMEGNISHINWARHQFELKGGNGVTNHVHFGQAKFSEAGRRVGVRELRVGEHVRVYSKAFDMTDRGLDATKIEIRDRGPLLKKMSMARSRHHYR